MIVALNIGPIFTDINIYGEDEKLVNRKHNEDAMSLIEVIVTLFILVLTFTITAAGFLQLRSAQETASLRSQGHTLVYQQLSDYRNVPFERLAMKNDLKTTPVANGGLFNVTSYKSEAIVFNSRPSDDFVPYKQPKVIGSSQYMVTTHVTKPSKVTNTDYQPVRVWVKIDLGGNAGVVEDSALIYPSYKHCPQKRALDPKVSAPQGCAL